MPHEIRYHVYPTDCDVFGHVNHATMITLLEHARWALLEPLISLRDMQRGDVWTVVRHVDVDYAWQSVPGDDLVIRSGLARVGRTSYAIRQSVRHAVTNRVHAAGTITFVCLDRAGRPVPVPEAWRAAFPVWDDAADDAFVGREGTAPDGAPSSGGPPDASTGTSPNDVRGDVGTPAGTAPNASPANDAVAGRPSA